MPPDRYNARYPTFSGSGKSASRRSAPDRSSRGYSSGCPYAPGSPWWSRTASCYSAGATASRPGSACLCHAGFVRRSPGYKLQHLLLSPAKSPAPVLMTRHEIVLSSVCRRRYLWPIVAQTAGSGRQTARGRRHKNCSAVPLPVHGPPAAEKRPARVSSFSVS